MGSCALIGRLSHKPIPLYDSSPLRAVAVSHHFDCPGPFGAAPVSCDCGAACTPFGVYSGFCQAFRGPVERVRICASHSIFSALCAHTLRGPHAWTTCVYLFRHRSYVRFPLRLSHHQSVTYTVFTGSVSYGSFQRVSASDRHSATASASMTGGPRYPSPVHNGCLKPLV